MRECVLCAWGGSHHPACWLCPECEVRRVYGWQAQVDVGAEGVAAVASFLRQRGYVVEDVSEDRDYQTQDIDLRIRGKRQQRWRTVEVKTDTYTSGNLFLELTSSSGKPGCVFKSRAQWWCYWLSQLGVLLVIDLPALQYWLLENGHAYERKTVMSRRGKSVWSIEGIAVPWMELCHAKVAYKQTLLAEVAEETEWKTSSVPALLQAS